ncbi:MAG: hypothetical protein NZ805_09770 [Armatimonadetes bacterium]|nr:hypothetical protein [Armatimonadota bacterium]
MKREFLRVVAIGRAQDNCGHEILGKGDERNGMSARAPTNF